MLQESELATQENGTFLKFLPIYKAVCNPATITKGKIIYYVQ